MAGKMLSNRDTMCRIPYRFRMRDLKVRIPSVVVESRMLFKCFFLHLGIQKLENLCEILSLVGVGWKRAKNCAKTVEEGWSSRWTKA